MIALSNQETEPEAKRHPLADKDCGACKGTGYIIETDSYSLGEEWASVAVCDCVLRCLGE